jgi:hypothetical protein
MLLHVTLMEPTLFAAVAADPVLPITALNRRGVLLAADAEIVPHHSKYAPLVALQFAQAAGSKGPERA